MKTMWMAGGLGLMLLALAACSDPAANVTGTSAGDAKKETTEAGTELTFSNDGSKIDWFSSKVVTGSHDGGFRKFTGKAIVDGDTLKQIDVTIDMNSVWTDDDENEGQKLRNHLLSEDFFDAANHPESRFVTTEIKKEGSKHILTGNLTMRGTTKSISFPADVTLKDGKLTAKAEFKIDRQEWGVHFKGASDNFVRDDVVLKLDITTT